MIIPTRDRWDLLERTLSTVLYQSEVLLEVLIVDDGLGRETVEGAARLDDPRIRVLRQAERVGLSRARNIGAASARGEWIAFLDDDDLWAPTKLSTQLATARREGADFVHTASVSVDGTTLGMLGVEPALAPEAILPALLRSNCLPAGSSNIVVRRAFLEEVGGWDEELSHITDWDLWIRMAAAGRAASSPEALVGYVRHGRSMGVADASDFTPELTHMLAKLGAAAAAPGPGPDARAVAYWRAHLHRVAGRRRAASLVYLRAGVRHRHPASLLRAAAVLLGDGLMSRGRRAATRLSRRPAPVAPPPVMPEPEWLRALRQPGRPPTTTGDDTS